MRWLQLTNLDRTPISTLLAKATHWTWFCVPTLVAVDVNVPGAFPFGSLTAGALLGWHMWYTTCRANPRKDAAHAKQIKEQREHYEAILDKQNVAHSDSIDKLCDTLRSEK